MTLWFYKNSSQNIDYLSPQLHHISVYQRIVFWYGYWLEWHALIDKGIYINKKASETKDTSSGEGVEHILVVTRGV